VANMLSAQAKISLDQNRPEPALAVTNRALEVVTNPLLRGALLVLRARAHQALGAGAACAEDSAKAQALADDLGESPC
jgi:hypothetical protein